MKQLIEEAIRLSEQAVTLAEQGDWERFHDNESQRQQVIRSLNVVDIDASEVDHTREQFQQLIALNEQLEQLCQQQRADIVAKLQTLNQGAKAKKAYQE